MKTVSGRSVNVVTLTVERLMPEDHLCLFRDGNQWCCVRPNFVNLQESPAGFGKTMIGAYHDLIRVETPADLVMTPPKPLGRKVPCSVCQGNNGGCDTCNFTGIEFTQRNTK